MELKFTQEQVEETIARIEKGIEDWQTGRMTSPDDRDHIIDACMTLGIDWQDHEPLVERLANELFEDAGETWQSTEDVARFALAGLTDALELEIAA